MTLDLFTIGHSTRSTTEFVDLLRGSQVELVVDVRHMPRSRANPQFNREVLPGELHSFQIGYVHLAALGGLRSRPRGNKASPNLLWDNASFRNYADYAMTEEFHQGLTELRELGHKRRSAVMCAEGVWWRCHRRIIADYLICAGESVFHILGHNRVDRAVLTPGGICQPDGASIRPCLTFPSGPDTNQAVMCGRYDNLIPRDAYGALFRSGRLPRSNFPPRYNVAPTDQIPIVRVDPRDGMREVTMAGWGLIPFWMKEKPKVPHINARAETVQKLPLFREAFAKRRCLIPATGFYEWQQRDDGKQPYRFRRRDLEPFAFAGIWEFAKLGGEEILSAAMIVGEPNPLVGGVHDRMPVMLLPEDYDRWLDPGAKQDELRALLRPYDAALMEGYAVSRLVNSVRNDTEECIEPIEDQATDAAKIVDPHR